MLERLKGKGYKDRLLNPVDEFWDRKLGVRTFGYYPASGKAGDSDWRVHYTPTPYSDIFRFLKMVGLGRDDVFVDLGCGLGRAVFAAGYLGAKRSVGVEVAPELFGKAISNRNASNLRDRGIEFVCINAQNYSNRDTTVLFMFHPFGEATLRQVMGNIEASRAGAPARRLRIVYVNPVFDKVLEQAGWLERTAHLPPAARWSSAYRHPTSLWRSRA